MTNRSTRSFWSLSLVAALAAPSASAATIFVNAATLQPVIFQNGTTWALAYKSLATALNQSASGDDVWVAKGFYKPTLGTDRTASFVVKDGVRIFGGFVAGAATLADRDPVANQTVLSGEIGALGNADNSLHVMTTGLLGPTTVVSGLVITGGNADGAGTDNHGGGMRSAGTFVMADCVFVNNNAAVFGGGMSITGASAAVPVEISNCVFEGNSSGIGGAVDMQGGPLRFFFCTIVNNIGAGTNGGVRFLNAGTTSQINSCIVRGNTGTGSVVGQQVEILSSTVTFNTDNITGGAALGPGCIDADPRFLDPDGADGILGNIDDNLRLRGDSPCIDRGSTANMPLDGADLDGDGVVTESLPLDLQGFARRIEETQVPNGAGATVPAPDIGAFEHKRPRTVLVNFAAVGLNNGASWANAYTNLQSAIGELSNPDTGGPGEIWVAAGTYKPTATTNQTISFVPPPHVQIYGGFAGGELSRSARNWIANPTILSGEIGSAAVNDNSDTVVRYSGVLHQNDSILDGFVVTKGDGGAAGGIVADTGASPTVRNCRIISNKGGVLFSGNAPANPKLDNSIVAGNIISGVALSSTNASVTNCTIAHNTGGPALVGAGISVQSPGADIRNCLVFDNASNGVIDQNAQIGTPSGDGQVIALLSCCAIQGFGAGYPNDIGCFAIGADGGCNDANGADNVFGTLDDDYSPATCSDVVDSGDNAVSYPDTLDYDEDGDVSEALNLDIALAIRRLDLPVPNSGLGTGGIDIGAYERPVLPLPDADYNDDGHVDGADLALLLGGWGTSNAAIDLNGDCIIDGADLAIMLGSWG